MASDSPAPVHLLCLIHGMWGNPEHLAEAARIMKEKAELRDDDCQLEILVAQTNRDSSTYDGIDWGGERIADEVQKYIATLEEDGKKVTKLSVLGYSLGGLLARYLIGILHSRRFFRTVTPMNFATIATPHVGLPRFPSFWSRLTNLLGPRLLSRTGEQFYALDKWGDTGLPLLEVMADPKSVFLKALGLFKHKTFYANAVNDITVPYVTAAVEYSDPFYHHRTNGIEILFDPEYTPLIQSWTKPEVAPAQPPPPPILSKARWKKSKSSRGFLPPPLQFKFPFNILLYAALPAVIPAFFCLVLVRLSWEAHNSRTRIKLLEAGDSSQSSLAAMIRSIEKEMDDEIADFIDNTDNSGLTSTPSRSPTPALGSAAEQEPLMTMGNHSKEAIRDSKPTSEKSYILKPSQKRMVKNLNETLLPMGLEKKVAFIDPARNTHATIVSRDVKNFEIHKIGWGILRNWADHFDF